MPCLAHPLLEMGDAQLRVIGRKPDEIVPVPALDPALPFAAENGVHLTGEQIGKDKCPDRKRNRLQDKLVFRSKAGRRIRINLDLDLQDLAMGNRPGGLFCCLDCEEMLEYRL